MLFYFLDRKQKCRDQSAEHVWRWTWWWGYGTWRCRGCGAGDWWSVTPNIRQRGIIGWGYYNRLIRIPKWNRHPYSWTKSKQYALLIFVEEMSHAFALLQKEALFIQIFKSHFFCALTYSKHHCIFHPNRSFAQLNSQKVPKTAPRMLLPVQFVQQYRRAAKLPPQHWQHFGPIWVIFLLQILHFFSSCEKLTVFHFLLVVPLY